MQHKERIRALLAGQAVDRPPVSTWGHDFLREWSAADLASHTVERQRKYNYDFVKLNPRWTMFAEPWGNRYEPPTEQKFPRLTHKIVHTVADIAHVPQVTADHPVLREHEAALELVLQEIGEDVDVLVTIFSPLSVLGLLCGGVGEPLSRFAESAPAIVHTALKDITATLAAHTSALVNKGASGVFYAPLQWTSLDVCDEEFYNTFGRPYDLQVLQAANQAPLNILHVCGNNIALERFFDYPTQAINWDNFGPGNMSLAEAASRTDMIVAGGIPHRKLHHLDARQLREVAADVLSGITGGVQGRVMLTGGCGIGATVADDIRSQVTAVAEQMAAG